MPVNTSSTSFTRLVLLHSYSKMITIINLEYNILDIKVSIGSVITCSCGIVQNDHCIHTLYVLLKKFKVPATNPIIWQGNIQTMQRRIWIRSWKVLFNWNLRRGRKRNVRSTNTRRRIWIIIKIILILMTSPCFNKTQCAQSAMRTWMANVTLLVKPAKKVYIRSALRYGQGINKTLMLLLLAPCAVVNLSIQWWWSIRISRDGKLDSKRIKDRCVEAVEWRT